MSKHPLIVKLLDDVSSQAFGIKRTDALKAKLCTFCKKPAESFKDALSRKEYSITGMCQPCQDDFFE